MNFGKRLNNFLYWYEQSCGDFANQCGIPNETLRRILSGERDPSYNTLVKILRGMDPEDGYWLITGIEIDSDEPHD